MLRATRIVRSALKSTTNLTGIPVHPDPLPALAAIYTSTLSSLSHLPSSSVYRQATEAITKQRLSVVQAAEQEGAGGGVKEVEKELGKMVELLISEGKGEEGLVLKMAEWKTWEPLVEEPQAGQWRYFEPLSDDA